MTRFQTATLVLLLTLVATADASALGRRRRSQGGAPLPSLAITEPSQPSNLQRLHTLRVEVAQKQYDYVKELFRGGRLRAQDMIAARKQLHQATLESATTVEGRLRVLEEGVKHAQADYEYISAAADAGVASELDKVSARYALVTQEIQLEEEKVRQGQPVR
jgi:hypothetical protein